MTSGNQTFVINILTLLRDDPWARSRLRGAARKLMAPGQDQDDLMDLLGQCVGPNINGPVIGSNFQALIDDIADDTPE